MSNNFYFVLPFLNEAGVYQKLPALFFILKCFNAATIFSILLVIEV